MTYPCHWFSEQVGLASDLGSTNDVLIPLNNAFSGTNGENVVEHIENFLKIIDPLDLPNPLHFKNGKTKWPTCSLNEDGFYNREELPGMVRVGYMTYFQDYEWYDDLVDRKLKEEALKQKAIYERSWGDAKQGVMNFCAWLKRCFGNFHELDYELLVKLKEYW
ncbi:hypothetical protein Tco_0432919 [Tanacetum coccineum]